MYANLLSGRVQDTILANDQEIESRTHANPHPVVVSDPRYDEQVRTWNLSRDRYLSRIAADVQAKILRHYDFTPADFHASFVSVAPKGSIGGGKEDLSFLPDTHNAHKRLWLDSIATDTIVASVNDNPEIVTQAQAKTETGNKIRQIIPGPIWHWVKEAIAMFHSESAIFDHSETFQLGNDAWRNLADMRHRIERVTRRSWTVASDYANFNWLHTIPDMQAFWRRIFVDPVPRPTPPGEWGGDSYQGYLSTLGEWLASALERMYVRPTSGSGRFIHVLRGLMSGWRTTTIINNTMNFLYTQILTDALLPVLGVGFMSFCRVNGDDSDMVVGSLFCALMFLRTMSLAELDVQAGKQLISQDCSEFLRIWTDKDGQRGSLLRSVASFVSSDLQSPVIDAGPEYVSGCASALATLRRRGADPSRLDVLYDIVLLRYARISTWTQDHRQVTTQLSNPLWLYVPRSDGGWGCTKYGDQQRYHPNSHRQWPTARLRWSLDNSPNYGAKQMFSKIWKTFDDAGLDTGPLTSVYRDIVNVATHGVDTVGMKPEEDYVRLQYAKHIEWQNAAGPVNILPPQQRLGYFAESTAENALHYAMTCTEPQLLALRTYNVPDVLESATGRALGLGSITPRLKDLMFDRVTGDHVPYADIFARTNTDPAPMMRILADYPAEVADGVYNGHLVWPTQLYHTMPSEYLPIVDYVHKVVLQTHYKPAFFGSEIHRDLAHVIQGTNDVVARVFLRDYANRYKL
jgi:hypothetical protein